MYRKTRLYIMYLLGVLLVLPFFFGGNSFAAKDLMGQIFRGAYEQGTMFKFGEDADNVGDEVFRGSTEVDIGGKKFFDSHNSSSIIVKVTRLLLILTIAISVTMILYNSMVYIIQTGQGKEGKSLIKNVLLIVVGILVALFSIVIMTLIQSIPTTIDNELIHETNNKTDNSVLE